MYEIRRHSEGWSTGQPSHSTGGPMASGVPPGMHSELLSGRSDWSSWGLHSLKLPARSHVRVHGNRSHRFHKILIKACEFFFFSKEKGINVHMDHLAFLVPRPGQAWDSALQPRLDGARVASLQPHLEEQGLTCWNLQPVGLTRPAPTGFSAMLTALDFSTRDKKHLAGGKLRQVSLALPKCLRGLRPAHH